MSSRILGSSPTTTNAGDNVNLHTFQSEACRIFLNIPVGDPVAIQVCRGYPLMLDPSNRVRISQKRSYKFSSPTFLSHFFKCYFILLSLIIENYLLKTNLIVNPCFLSYYNLRDDF